MLHENPLMADIDVDHWRNLQSIVLESAKERRRIILIHENGELLKFVHSQRLEIDKNVDRIDRPLEDAEKVYLANADKTDFVAVLDRDAVDSFFAQIQDTWKADEDLDEFVHRTYATLDEYSDGIVTYPPRARTQLGLQWRIGASYEDVKAAVDRFVTPDTTVVFGVFEGDQLWTSLVLSFDSHKRVTVVTTVDPSELSGGGDSFEAAAKEVVEWAGRKYSRCSLGLFMDRDGATALLSSGDKLSTLRELRDRHRLVADPLPEGLGQALNG